MGQKVKELKNGNQGNQGTRQPMYFFLLKKNVIKKQATPWLQYFFRSARTSQNTSYPVPSRFRSKFPFFFSESLSVKGQFLNFFDVQELKDFRGTSWNMYSKSKLHFIQGHCQEKVQYLNLAKTLIKTKRCDTLALHHLLLIINQNYSFIWASCLESLLVHQP